MWEGGGGGGGEGMKMPGLEEYLELLEKYWRKEAWERGLGEWGGGGHCECGNVWRGRKEQEGGGG